MTREEADFIGALNMCDEISNEAYKKIMCHCEEQEPCKNCVSRRAVYEILNDAYFLKIDDGAALQESVRQLPPVTPQKKMGKWKAFTHSAYRGNDEDGEPIWREVTVYHCNMCNRRTVIKEKYCPNCGCKMQGVEE